MNKDTNFNPKRVGEKQKTSEILRGLPSFKNS
jgi:hypothetical protein